MNQQGVTFLEVIVVVAILLIVSSLVSPSIQGWRQKRALESDFHVWTFSTCNVAVRRIVTVMCTVSERWWYGV